jgi:hypothetical protein
MISTWRELEAVNRVLKSNAESLIGVSWKVYTDNKNVETILNIKTHVCIPQSSQLFILLRLSASLLLSLGIHCDDIEISFSWDAPEACTRSTWRELEAVNRVLMSNAESLIGVSLKVYIDNKNVETILRVGSKKSLWCIPCTIYFT